ncbi:MAG TPA: hypothetical protein VFR83_11340 [Burkholderiales bacterium]|nr:hypothetical protein [Burkholderiales bacterium]
MIPLRELRGRPHVALDPRRVEGIDRARRSVQARPTGDGIRSPPRLR